MSEKQNSISITAPQLLILLFLQLSITFGAFYLGLRWGVKGGVAEQTEKNAVVSNPDLAALMPGASSEKNSDTSAAPSATDKNYNTAFDKSSSAVFRIKSSANSEYSLQIASFPQEEAAIEVVNAWKRKGYLAYLSVQDIPEQGKWYQVRVGNYGDEESAKKEAQKIEEKEQVAPQVVSTQ